MKSKYPKPVWLIITFYLLILIVGSGQIFWAIGFETVYDSPTIDGFYMIYRATLSLCIVILFSLRRQSSLYWTIIIESSTNIFISLFYIYEAIWRVIRTEDAEEFQEMLAWYGMHTGWNAILGLISVVILGYIITKWKQLMTQQDGPGQPPTRPEFE